jgi:hypothetical protein
LNWWKSFRPINFSLADHIKNPTINLHRHGEESLGRIAAELAQTAAAEVAKA